VIEWCGLIIVASTRLPRYLSFDVPPVNVPCLTIVRRELDDKDAQQEPEH